MPNEIETTETKVMKKRGRPSKKDIARIPNIEERLSHSLTPATKRAYIADIKEFFNVKEVNEIRPEQIKEVDVDKANQFFNCLAEKNLKITTVNRKMTSLSYFYSFLSRKDIGIVNYNPFSVKEGARRFKNVRNYSNTRALTVDEVKRIVAMANKDSLIPMRDKIILLLLSTTGMRREEIVSIRLGDIYKERNKWVAEIIGKGDKNRLIVIAPEIMGMIEEYVQARGLTMESCDSHLISNHSRNYKNEAMSTITVYNIVKKYANLAGVDEETISPHSLRHTFITTSLENGAKIEDVQDMAGHSSINTTRRYDHTNRVLNNNTSEKLCNMFTDNK